MATGNADFDAIASTTLQNYRKTLEDNIFNAMPLLFWLKEKKRMENGGRTIVTPLMYGKNSTVKSYDGYETLDVTPQEGITAAEFNWKQVSGSVSISRKEERQNAGETQIVNLLNSKIQQLELSVQDALSIMSFSDGTGNSGKDLLGLQAIVANDPTTGTLGGIDRSVSANSWWRNTTLIGTKTSTAFDNLQTKMRRVYNSTSKGIIHPNFGITDQVTFEGYESTLVDQKRFTNDKSADAGFQNLLFKAMTLMFDEAAPSTSTLGNMYFLNSKFLEWVVDSKTNFIMSPFVRPENQDAKTSQMLFMGNLVVSNCERQGVIYSIDLT